MTEARQRNLLRFIHAVSDPQSTGQIVNEYNYGKGTPDVKSYYNTLDDEPGGGPFAFLTPKLNNFTNYYT